jgi:hypothetical protein
MKDAITGVGQFVTQHEAVLSLFALAFIVTMPAELPEGWANIPDWLYGWLHDGLKAFVSFRSPKAPTEPKP